MDIFFYEYLEVFEVCFEARFFLLNKIIILYRTI